jgi:hypothetical protein
VAYYSGERIRTAPPVGEAPSVLGYSVGESPAIIRNSWLAYGDTVRRYDCRKTN